MEEGEREKAAWVHVEALNHALRGIPTEQIRHHTCYGLNHGPRMNDIPLIKAVPFMLAISAGAHSFEVANPRITTSGGSGRTSTCPRAGSSCPA